VISIATGRTSVTVSTIVTVLGSTSEGVPPPSAPELIQIATAEHAIDGYMAKRHSPLGLRAESNRLWSTIRATLGRIASRLSRDPVVQIHDRARIGNLLTENSPLRTPDKSTIQSAWALSDELDHLLIDVADLDLVAVLVSEESDWESESLNRFLDRDVLKSMRSVFGAYETVSDSAKEWPQVRARAEARLGRAREFLHSRYERRAFDRRVWRQRTENRKRNLLSAGVVLALVVVALIVFIANASSLALPDVMITALAGALAGTLARMYKMRDVYRISQLRDLYADFFAQPFVGASIALFVLMFISSGILQLPGASSASWAALATYGFVAAFSEPFFLKLVGRVGSGETEHHDAPH
jgi:hypothetical protein